MSSQAPSDLRDAVHVWTLFVDRLPSGWEARCADWLAPDERAHRDRLATPELQRDYLATRALCRSTLSRYTGVDPAAWVFAAGEFGKPAIVAPAEWSSLRFNLTRTRGFLACALTCVGDVGIDAEETSREVDVAQMARHFFSPSERAALDALPPERRAAWFIEQWTLKEAYLKGRGTGLSESPEGFTIDRDSEGGPQSIGAWQLSRHRPSPRHVAAVAVRAEGVLKEVPVVWSVAELT